MKPRAFILAVSLGSALLSAHAFADETLVVGGDGSSASKQLLTIEGGDFQPRSVLITNGTYNFNYSPDSLNAAWVEAGFGAHLFDALGSFYLEASLGFTNFSGVAQSNAPTLGGQNMSVMMLGLDARLMYQATWFPVRFLIPFVDAGYQGTFYYQSGQTDLQSAEGAIGNPVAGAGLNIWLNSGSSKEAGRINMFSNFPIFLTAKVNQIFPHSGGLNLASTTFLGGLTFGL